MDYREQSILEAINDQDKFNANNIDTKKCTGCDDEYPETTLTHTRLNNLNVMGNFCGWCIENDCN